MTLLGGGPVQVAYGVVDVEQAALDWIEHGAGPFYVRHHISVNDVLIGAEPGHFDHSSAYGQWGSVMIELVAVHSPTELAATGIHHMAYFVPSVAAASIALSAQGWPRALRASAGSTTFAFHDARADLGHLIELYEPGEQVQNFYKMVAEAAQDWDGSEPVRSV